MGLCQTKQDLQKQQATVAQVDDRTLQNLHPSNQKQVSTTTSQCVGNLDITQANRGAANETHMSLPQIEVHPPSESIKPVQSDAKAKENHQSLISGSSIGSLLKTLNSKQRQTDKRQQSQLKNSIFAQSAQGSKHLGVPNPENRLNPLSDKSVSGANTLMVPGCHRTGVMTSHINIQFEENSSAYPENSQMGSLMEESHWPKKKQLEPQKNHPIQEQPLGANGAHKDQPSGATARARNRPIALTSIPERVDSKPSVWRVDKGNKK